MAPIPTNPVSKPFTDELISRDLATRQAKKDSLRRKESNNKKTMNRRKDAEEENVDEAKWVRTLFAVAPPLSSGLRRAISFFNIGLS